MVVTLGQHYNAGKKPTVILCTLTLIIGTNPIHRDSFVKTDQSQTSLAGKYCEIRPMKDDFCKDFIRTGRGDWRAWYISHSTMI